MNHNAFGKESHEVFGDVGVIAMTSLFKEVEVAPHLMAIAKKSANEHDLYFRKLR